MKQYRLFGFDIRISVRRVKRLSISIPDWADDCWKYIEEDGSASIRYFKGCEPHYIPLPKCRDVEVVSVDSLYDREKSTYRSDRKIVVDLYL